MRNILVTGSNGFIGRNIVAGLGNREFIIGTGRKKESNSLCNNYIKWDIGSESEPDKLKDLDIDYIVHTAASLDKDNLSESLVSTNCLGSFKIVKLAVEHNVKCIIYISSLPIIGSEHEIPINEKVTINPPSMYHATKAAGELIIGQADSFGIRSVSLRVPSPIGVGMPTNTIVPVFIQRAMSDADIIIQGKGTRKQNYLDVRDIVEAVRRIINHSDITGVFNIGSKNILSNIELALKCIEILKSKSRIIYTEMVDPYDEVNWTTNDSKLRSKIGDYQNHSIEESIIDIAKDIK